MARQMTQRPTSKRLKETDPHGLDAHTPGAKLDEGKTMAGILADFSLALQEVAKVGSDGAIKYTRGGWQQVSNGVERYDNAFWRHLLDSRHERIDPTSGHPHKAHMIWNALAALELELRTEKGL